MRKLLIAVFVVILLVAVVAIAGVLRVRGIKPDYDDVVASAPVQKPVEVWHDSAGIPHLWAQTEEDLYFAQGYAHAQERLWQMELFRRVSEGRLAEVLGESMIDTDKFLRTLGIWRAAGANEARLDADQKRLLQSYVAGVNSWIEQHDGPLPPEFTVLRIHPERWTIRNSLAIEGVMSWDLALYSDAAALTQAVNSIGAEKAKFLEPSDPSWGAVIVPGDSTSKAPQITQITKEITQMARIPLIPEMPPMAASLLDALSITRASNGWVIGGARTVSGKPILANDMHLALRQPGVWYLMALHGPDIDVAGMTLPGVPNVVAGHNKAVAWGFTNVMMDDVDFFVERVDSSDPGRYLTPTGSEAFQTVNESLRVKGRKDPINFTIRITRHGPVMSDVDKKLKGADVISIQWAALDASHSLSALPRMNRAHNAREFVEALALFDNPHQNVVYADTAGHFGYQMAGRIPIRGDRKRPPMLPVPGWTGEWDWKGYVPFAEHPSAPDPANGYAVTANNRQVRSALGDLISNDWELPFRAMRIEQMVLAKPKHDWSSVHAMQLDVTDLLAQRYKGAAAKAAEGAGLKSVAVALNDWDGVAERASRPAAYFYVWYESLRWAMARNLFGSKPGSVGRKVVNTMLDSGRIGWVRERGEALLDSMSRGAMLRADSIAHDKTWGDLHEVVVEHAMGSVPAVEKLLSLNVGPAPHRGSPTTVNVAQYSGHDFPLRTSYGPSERHVVDMSDVDGTGGFILPTGESGLPGSDHYADMFDRWRNGGLWKIPLDKAAAARVAVNKTVIQPRKTQSH